LLQQNEKTLHKYRPDLNQHVGVVSAGLDRDERTRPIVIGGVQSLHARLEKMSATEKHVDLLVVDESHLVRPDDGQFVDIITTLETINPKLRVVGLTASPFRLDLGPIVGPAAPFQKMSYTASMRNLIERGFLVDMKCFAPQSGQIDTSGVRTTAGEFNARDLENAAMSNLGAAVKDAAGRLMGELSNRKCVKVFCTGVGHAKAAAKMLSDAGVSAEAVSGDDNDEERERKISAFKAGKIRALCSVQILTTGFDHPPIDAIIDLSPTKSPVKYIQTRGRGSRPYQGKSDTMILDYAGNTMRHGPLDRVKPPRKPGESTGEAPMKVCPKCEHIVATSTRTCPHCGNKFPVGGGNLSKVPQAGNATTFNMRPAWYKVKEMKVALNPGRNGKPPTLRLDFRYLIPGGNLTGRVSKFLSLEKALAHPFAYSNSCQDWQRLSSARSRPPPTTVVEGVMRSKAGELVTPAQIYVDFTREHPDVKAFDIRVPA
jgi:DNA repair protein RadD